jgi:hypothetical protein
VLAVGLVALVIALVTMRTGVASDSRLANPNPGPRPYGAFLGVGNWPMVMSVTFPICLAGYGIWMYRRSRKLGALDPIVIVLAVVCSMSIMDPPANWATFTVFDPRFPHFPTSWPWMRLAPLVEPVPNFLGGYPFFYLSMALISVWVYERFVLPRTRSGGFIRRHPVWSMFGFGFALCIPLDTLGQFLFMTQRFYVYTQGWGPSFHLQGFALPMIWGFYDWVLVGLTCAMMRRNDRGQSAFLVGLAAKLPSGGSGDRQSAGRQILAGAIVANLAALALIGVYGIVRVSGLTHPTYEHFPYTEAKVYDPYGDLRDAGKAGPFYR